MMMSMKESSSLRTLTTPLKTSLSTHLTSKPKLTTPTAICKNSLLRNDKSLQIEGTSGSTKNIFSTSFNEARNLFVSRNAHNIILEKARPRSRTWTQGQTELKKGQTSSLLYTPVVFSTNFSEKIKPFKLKVDQKTKCLRKLNEIVGKILKKNLEHWRYDPDLSRKRCTVLSQIIETTIKTTLNVDQNVYKVVAIIFISAVRGDGMKHACQCSWYPDTDLFVTETFRREDLTAVANVFATLIERGDT